MDNALLKRLRALFEEERRVQWTIGDELVRHLGPAPANGVNDASHQELAEYAEALGQSIATLMQYRRMATTFAPSTRVQGASFSAHRAAAHAKDPAKVMAEVVAKAERTGNRITVAEVHHVAAKPVHRKPDARPAVRRNEWDEELISSIGGSTRNLGRLLRVLRSMDEDEELTPKYAAMVREAVDRCADYIQWIRATLAGEDVAAEAEEFLRSNSA